MHTYLIVRGTRVAQQRQICLTRSNLRSGRTTLACLVAAALTACSGADWGEAVVQEASASTQLVTSTEGTGVVAAAPAASELKAVTPKPMVEEQMASATKPAASTPAANPAAQNWVDTLVNDMVLFHDGPTYTLKYITGWGTGRNYPETYSKPDGWTIAGPWGVIAADYPVTFSAPWRDSGPYTGNQAPNTRVQVRDIQLWWLKPDGQWVLGSHDPTPSGEAFHAGFTSNLNIPADVRDEASNGGGVSVRYINYGSKYGEYVYHFYGSGAQVPSNYVGFATVYFARKILHDPKGPDDRASARLLADAAGDWWTGPGAQWDNFKTNAPMGYNRFKYLSNEWQLISFHSLTEAQLRANPPPIKGL